MAFNEQELEIIRAGTEAGKSKEDIKSALIKYRSGYVPPTPTEVKPATFTVPSIKEVGKSALEVGKGFVKNTGETLNALADIPGPINTILNPLNKPDGDIRIPEPLLESQNTEQKVGKGLGLLAEIFYPVGATGVASKGAKAVGATLEGIGPKLAGIGDDVVEGGSKVKDKLLDVVVNLDDKTKTALQRTPLDVFQNVVEKGKAAMLDDRNRTPLEAVGDSVAEALVSVKDKMSKIGAEKAEYAKFNGIQGFDSGVLKKANEKLQSFLNSRDFIEDDKKIIRDIVSQFKELGETPSVGGVDRFIDYAQSKLYAGEKNLTVTLTDKTTGALKKIVGDLNEAVKDKMPGAYRELNDEYSRLIEFVGELNTKLGKESGNAGSLIKRLFSPSDARTKELFDLLEKETGQDFFRDARLAKFVMETLGDTRAASLLEQLPTSAGGLINKALEFVIDKVRDPIKGAERFIKKNLAPKEQGKLPAEALAALPSVPDEDEDVSDSLSALGLVGLLGQTKQAQASKEAWKIVKALSKRRAELVRMKTTNPDKNASITDALKSIDDSIRRYSQDI